MGVFRNKWLDSILKRGCLLLCSVPTFWLGLLIMLVFSVFLGWFPLGLSSPIGVVNSDVTIWQKIHHLILPALTLSFLSFANIALHTRQKLVDVLESDYVLFAKARGESQWGDYETTWIPEYFVAGHHLAVCVLCGAVRRFGVGRKYFLLPRFGFCGVGSRAEKGTCRFCSGLPCLAHCSYLPEILLPI